MTDDHGQPGGSPLPSADYVHKKRRRSFYVANMLVSGAALLSLGGCSDDLPAEQTQARIFPTVEACIVEFSKEQCEVAFNQSRQIHAEAAPRFQDAAACEQETGEACQRAPGVNMDGSLTDFFVPAMMGFMLAEALDDLGDSRRKGYYSGGSLYSDGRRYAARPLYVDRNGFLRSGSFQVGRLPSDVSRESWARSSRSSIIPGASSQGSGGYTVKATQPTPSRVTTRGGFGSSASHFSSSGGG
jgi:uncharacterized protein YgiB involved in biofilm formation